jgi:hypothetical protein
LFQDSLNHITRPSVKKPPKIKQKERWRERTLKREEADIDITKNG